jgi:hypothetical protein
MSSIVLVMHFVDSDEASAITGVANTDGTDWTDAEEFLRQLLVSRAEDWEISCLIPFLFGGVKRNV